MYVCKLYINTEVITQLFRMGSQYYSGGGTLLLKTDPHRMLTQLLITYCSDYNLNIAGMHVCMYVCEFDIHSIYILGMYVAC